jgi:hypothetical protein
MQKLLGLVLSRIIFEPLAQIVVDRSADIC